MKAVVGLGTNLGDRIQNLRDALASIDRVVQTRVIRCSRIYESKPYGYAAQGDFLNMAAELDTALQPEALLGTLLGIEAGLGRVREFKKRPACDRFGSAGRRRVYLGYTVPAFAASRNVQSFLCIAAACGFVPCGGCARLLFCGRAFPNF